MSVAKTVGVMTKTVVRLSGSPTPTPTLDFMDRGHLDGEIDHFESQVLSKSCAYYGTSCPERTNSCQTPTPDS